MRGRVAGLSAKELSRVRGRLEEFAAAMFAPLPRKDQRGWGGVYLRGLMLEGKRKSIEPMAARLEDGDEQCLQQFVNQSPWDWLAVRRALARRMSAEIAPGAGVIDDTGFPEAGQDVCRRRASVLRRVGEGRQLSAGGVDQRGDRAGVVSDRLAAVRSRSLG